ncbi:nuclear transport factor 2 family protein [Actinomycetospora flava]|uniref:Nuclear transport factor 2 family protein n=1 Tax=Actinomycetospora flava TaxID=3129232 RepID=A0ABU8M8H3_9PSEU
MTSDADLVRRVELLEARWEIARLISSFAHGLDLQDRDLLRSVFFSDSVLDLGHLGRHEGIEEIVASFEAQWKVIPHMHHWFADPLIDIDLDAGTATDTVTVDVFLTDLRSGPSQIASIYRDRLERRDGAWRFTHRQLEIYYWTPVANWVPTAGTESRTDGPSPGPSSNRRRRQERMDEYVS